MFKYRDYSKNKKGGGSREPLPFIDKDPLFYLSSFQIPFREEPAAESSGFFLRPVAADNASLWCSSHLTSLGHARPILLRKTIIY